MKKFATFAVLSGAALALAACDSSDDISEDAEADGVEITAEQAMEPVEAMPVQDTMGTAPEPEVDPAEADAETQATAEAAGESAAEVAARAQAAAADAEVATDSTEDVME